MGTLTSFFGGGGGGVAIPNASYDPIRKATYKSVLTISQSANFKMVPMSDTTFATFSGASNTSTLYGGHYTINTDGSLTQTQAPTSLGVLGTPFAGCATAEHVLLYRTSAGPNGQFDKVAWNGSTLSLTNIISTVSVPASYHCAGTHLYNGYLVAIVAEQSGNAIIYAMIRPDGTTQGAGFTTSMKYGTANQVHYTGASDGVYGFGRPSAGQSSTYYGIGYQFMSPGAISGSNWIMASVADNLATNNTTMDQISSIASWPSRTAGAHFFGVDGNSRYVRGMGAREGLSVEFSQSPAATPTTNGEITFASDAMTHDSYGNWRQYNGTVTDGLDNSLLTISNEGMGGYPVPSAFNYVGLRNANGLTPSTANVNTIQVGKYLVAAGEASGTNQVVLNVYEVE